MSHIRVLPSGGKGAVRYTYRRSMEMFKNVVSWRQVYMKPKLESQPDTNVQIRRPSPGQGQIEQRHQRAKLVDVLKGQFIVSWTKPWAHVLAVPSFGRDANKGSRSKCSCDGAPLRGKPSRADPQRHVLAARALCTVSVYHPISVFDIIVEREKCHVPCEREDSLAVCLQYQKLEMRRIRQSSKHLASYGTHAPVQVSRATRPPKSSRQLIHSL